MFVGRAQIPLVRLSVPFITGIVTTLIHPININSTAFLLTCLGSLTVLFAINKYVTTYNHRWAFGLICFIILFISGLKIIEEKTEINSDLHFSNYSEVQGFSLIKLIEPVAEKANSFQITGRVLAIIHNDSIVKTIGKVVLYLEKDDNSKSLKYGDVIVTENNFQEPTPPRNPGEFNYKRFLSNNNIFNQAYRRSGDWSCAGINNGNLFFKYSNRLRDGALALLENSIVRDREYAVASALVLGLRDNLDAEIQQGFAGAGAMHVLCVSGLHVGIIFLILKSIFGFLASKRKGRILQALLIIVLIWLYAAVTGLTPSVLRASTMFSFVAVGNCLNRKTNIYNTLAASALLLLLIDPFIITKIGFQLSYTAVIGIVSLQPGFYKLLYFKNKIIDKAWAIITVSVAAQIATGPISIFYFNQFPNYFILTNLIVIPLASIVIYMSLAIFVSSPISVLSSALGYLLSGFIMFMNESVLWIESMPGSVSYDIYLSLPETLIIVTLIIALYVALINKKKSLIKVSLLMILLLFSSFSTRGFKNMNNSIFVVYNINNQTAIDFISGKENVFVSCKGLNGNEQTIKFHIHENRLRNGIKDSKANIIVGEDISFNNADFLFIKNFIRFNDLTLLLLTHKYADTKAETPIKIDYLIISQNPQNNPVKTLELLKPAKVIIDSSNNFYNSRQWEKACNDLNIEVWNVRINGAYQSSV